MTRRCWPVCCFLSVTMLVSIREIALAQTADGGRKTGPASSAVFQIATIEVQCGERRQVGRERQVVSPGLGTKGGGKCPGEVVTSWFDPGDRSILPLSDRLIVHGSVQFNTTSSHAGFGQTWQTRTMITYRAPGGIELTAGAVGRRGYEAPLFVTEGLASGGLPFVTNSPLLDTTRRPILWDTVLRVEKDVLRTGRLRATVVGEAYNLVNLNGDPDTKPLTETLTSRVVLLGLKVRF